MQFVRKPPGEEAHEVRDRRVSRGSLTPWRCADPKGGTIHHGVVEMVADPRRTRGRVGDGVGGCSSCLMVELDFDGEIKGK